MIVFQDNPNMGLVPGIPGSRGVTTDVTPFLMPNKGLHSTHTLFTRSDLSATIARLAVRGRNRIDPLHSSGTFVCTMRARRSGLPPMAEIKTATVHHELGVRGREYRRAQI